MLYSKKFYNRIFEDAADPTDSNLDVSNAEAMNLLKDQQVAEEPQSEEMVKDMTRSGTTYGFPINETSLKDINTLIERGEGEWNSSDPLKLMKDGKSGDPAMMVNKPVYLKIRLTRSKTDRQSQPAELEMADRVYILLDTNSQSLKSMIDKATDITNSVRVSVQTPLLRKGEKIEHSLEFWKDLSRKSDPTADSAGSGEMTKDVKIDWAQQLAAPGTSAGIGESRSIPKKRSNPVNESNGYRWMKFIR
jgi:hypothetical protein